MLIFLVNIQIPERKKANGASETIKVEGGSW
jgi:hypothetical protein